jgi:amino acid adenylation domain-containing protein
MWMLDRITPGNPAFNLVAAISVAGPLDTARLAAALNELIRRQEILRTSFAVAGGEPCQQIYDELIVEILEEDSVAASSEPFDLQLPPLWRLQLIRRSPGDALLVLTMHHSITDGDWTARLFFEGLAKLHEGLEVPASAHQYCDYAVWQRANWTAERFEPQLAYWRGCLDSPSAQLASARPRPPLKTYAGASLNFSTSAAIQAVAGKSGVPLFVALLSVFKILVHRYTQAENIVVGYPVSGRHNPFTEGLIGYFGNPLALRTQLAASMTFHDVLAAVSATVAGAEANQDCPFQNLVEAINPPRDLSSTPFFQTMFSMRSGPGAVWTQMRMPAQSIGRLTLANVDIDSHAAAYDLALMVTESAGALVWNCEYNTDLFDEPTIQRLPGHLEVLLNACASTPDRPISQLPFLTGPELARIESEWNHTARTPYRRVPIYRLVEEQVDRAPGAPAVEFDDASLTYGELDRRANQLAHYLIHLGAGPDRLIGLCMDRSVEVLVAILAILKSGAAYVPLDSAYPADRLRYMIADAGIAVVLTTAPTVAASSDLAGLLSNLETIRVDTDWHLIAARPETRPAAAVEPHHLAYCLYTSGSTGEPKGVSMEHGALANLMAWHKEAWLSEPGTRILLFSPLSFDVSFHEIAAGWCTGGTLVQLHEEVRRDAVALLDILNRRSIQKLYVPYVALQQLALAAGFRGMPSSVREIVVGGEPLQITPEIADFIRQTRCVLQNQYGSTECLVVTAYTVHPGDETFPAYVPVGKATVYNTRVYVLDANLQHVPIGIEGTIFADSDCLARGYHNRPELTAERFIPNPFTPDFSGRLYKLGDRGRYLPSGDIECLGRADHQLKIRGFRVEPGEVETVLARHPAVAECAVVPREDVQGLRRLVAFVVPAGPDTPDLRSYLKDLLPGYMVPDSVELLDRLPLTPSGKVNRAALSSLKSATSAAAPAVAPRSDLESRIAAVWRELLGLPSIDVHQNFFDLGATSLLVVQAQRNLGLDLPPLAMFRYPTVASLAQALSDQTAPAEALKPALRAASHDIAVIGIACRFPGAASVDQFWDNLRNGVESISFYRDEELEIDPLAFASYIKAGGILPDVAMFDARFFGFSPREAEMTDPQLRFLLECAWETLENAGYAQNQPLRAGVYVGSGMSTYLINNIVPSLGIPAEGPFMDSNSLSARIGNDRNYYATRVAYKLNLQGPAINLHTACSTSLVAVHMACQSIRSGECEMAFAGGVAIPVPQKTGYAYEDGNIRSPDGHTRTFDADAHGTVFTSGVGLVLLKPLDRARADGDTIHAVVRGSAINNDGALKVSYSAPSMDGQSAAIAAALADAGVEPRSIGYVEAHGTATNIGDPIEVGALTQAFQSHGPLPQQFCGLGAVKSNIGHTDEAAGIAGFIKAVLSVRNGEIPPTLHYKSPNPRIDFPGTPFYVNDRLKSWHPEAFPRRAGVSAFGIGGTNCHVVLEQPPAPAPASTTPRVHILALSALSTRALRDLAARYAAFLRANPAVPLADFCFTASAGRRQFPHRLAVTGSSAAELAASLESADISDAARPLRKVAFLFSGQGSQHTGMGTDLYQSQPVFHEAIDRSGVLDVLNSPRIHSTDLAQPALFALEYALAQLWQSWGVSPSVVLGHSVGEIAAACVAGAYSFEDGLRLISQRGAIMQSLPDGGTMASVLAAEEAVRPFVAPYASTVAIAAVNSPLSTVISGAAADVETICAALQARGISSKPLHVSHAFHSPLMEPAEAPLESAATAVRLSRPAIPVISNLTGQPAGPDAFAPAYWRAHLRQPVRFAASIASLDVDALIEIGPDATLLGLARQCLGDAAPVCIPSQRRKQPGSATALEALATYYTSGGDVDWNAVHRAHGSPRRIPIPNYPFQRERYWIDPPPPARAAKTQLRPLVESMIRLPRHNEVVFESDYSRDNLPYLADHLVFGALLAPGALHLATMFAAAELLSSRAACSLSNVVLPSPFVAAEGVSLKPQLIFAASQSPETYDAELIGPASDPPAIYAAGTVSLRPSAFDASLTEPRQRCQTPIPVEQVYEGSPAFEFGPAFRWIEALWTGDREAIAKLRRPSAISSLAGYPLHPCLLDACLQVTLAEDDDEKAALPFAIAGLHLRAAATGDSWWCHSARTGADTWDIHLFSESGEPLAAIRGFQVRRAAADAVRRDQVWNDWLYSVAWEPRELPATPVASPESWRVVSDSLELGAALEAQGQHLATAAQNIVYLPEPSLDSPNAVLANCARFLELIQQADASGTSPAIWLVTRNAQSVLPGDSVHLGQAPLWGLARTARAELSAIPFRCVDIDSLTDAPALAAILLAGDPEPQTAYRQGKRHSARLKRQKLDAAVPSGPTEIYLADYGSPDDLRVRELRRRAPGPGEIEIEVRAAGLNFRDVINVLGMLKEHYAATYGIRRAADLRLGFECSGVVSAVGPDVANFSPGDRVMALTEGCFAAYATLAAERVAPLPAGATFEGAATIPMAMQTACKGLYELAQLKAGDRVLIHAAAGGVGQAAVQLAQAAGAEVFATASPAKWDFLRAQGVAHIYNSRTQDFAAQLLEDTAGRGVDVVFNSLTGDFIPNSVRVLAPAGRFVEIGKLGIWTREQMSAQRPDVAYFPFELGEAPDDYANMTARVSELWAAGRIHPLPYETFPAGQISAAVRHMQLAKHTGKIVLSFRPAVDPAAAYLITGGTGGLGLKIAQALVDSGAKHLVLASRRATLSPDAANQVSTWRDAGVSVEAVAADVSQPADVRRLLDRTPPVRGIVHSAGLLDDGILARQSPERLANVMASKVSGAWNLHTLAADLDWFVLFSSSASLIETPGQGNYAAANAFLDALAHFRRAQGQPALSINWGPWSEVGMSAALKFDHQGIGSISPEQGAAVFTALLNQASELPPQIAALPIRWPAFLTSHPAVSPFYADFQKAETPREQSALSVRQELEAAAPDVRSGLLSRTVSGVVAKVLGLSSAEVDPNQSLMDLGLDSLLAVELRNKLSKTLGLGLPATLLFEYPNLRVLNRFLFDELFPAEDDIEALLASAVYSESEP